MRPRRPVACVAALTVMLAGPVAAHVQARAQRAPRIEMAEFKKLLDENAIVVLDVRDPESYAEGHIPGALLVPEYEIGQYLPKLEKIDKPIVTYCS